jgi:hypothetical protein
VLYRQDGRVSSTAVFVFTQDQDMLIFWDEADAAAWMDQDPGVAEAVYDVAGTLFDIERRDPNSPFFVLHRTTNVDPQALRQRIQQHLDLTGSDASSDDPQALADQHFRKARERRWPR